MKYFNSRAALWGSLASSTVFLLLGMSNTGTLGSLIVFTVLHLYVTKESA